MDKKDLVETYGEPAVEVVSELLLEGVAGAIIPGFTSVVMNVKQKRYERNINRLLAELQTKFDRMSLRFDEVSEVRRSNFHDEFSELIIDYISEERDEDKIEYIVNGITNLIDDNKAIDNTSLYFDALKSLRKIDILVLKQFDYNSPEFFERDFNGFLEKCSITHDEYKFIKEKLQRSGLLISTYDEDQKNINEIILELSKFLKELEKGTVKKVSNKLNSPKIKKMERIKLSRFGREFIDFFTENSEDES